MEDITLRIDGKVAISSHIGREFKVIELEPRVIESYFSNETHLRELLILQKKLLIEEIEALDHIIKEVEKIREQYYQKYGTTTKIPVNTAEIEYRKKELMKKLKQIEDFYAVLEK